MTLTVTCNAYCILQHDGFYGQRRYPWRYIYLYATTLLNLYDEQSECCTKRKHKVRVNSSIWVLHARLFEIGLLMRPLSVLRLSQYDVILWRNKSCDSMASRERVTEWQDVSDFCYNKSTVHNKSMSWILGLWERESRKTMLYELRLLRAADPPTSMPSKSRAGSRHLRIYGPICHVNVNADSTVPTRTSRTELDQRCTAY